MLSCWDTVTHRPCGTDRHLSQALHASDPLLCFLDQPIHLGFFAFVFSFYEASGFSLRRLFKLTLVGLCVSSLTRNPLTTSPSFASKPDGSAQPCLKGALGCLTLTGLCKPFLAEVRTDPTQWLLSDVTEREGSIC